MKIISIELIIFEDFIKILIILYNNPYLILIIKRKIYILRYMDIIIIYIIKFKEYR
jgi:hypothetical protein